MRRSINQIMDEIFEVLNDSEHHHIADVAKRIKSTWLTASNYLQLIEWVQDQPELMRGSLGGRANIYWLKPKRRRKR